jgi:hypothetical protein
MQRVQTYLFSVPPLCVLTLTFWTLGDQLRLVFLWLWLTKFPLIFPFPQTEQTLDIFIPLISFYLSPHYLGNLAHKVRAYE